MIIKTEPFVMKKLLCYSAIYKLENWEDGFDTLLKIGMKEGLYRNGPLFFSMKEVSGEPEYREFSFYMPVNLEVEFEKNTGIVFVKEIVEEMCLSTRLVDDELQFSDVFKYMFEIAIESEYKLKEYSYCICHELYGEYVLDVFVPICEGA